MNNNLMKLIILVCLQFFFDYSYAITLTCPKQFSQKESTLSGWIVNQSSQKKTNNATLVSSDILQGLPGDEKKAFPALLAPDQETKKNGDVIQVWNITSKPVLLI